MVKLNFMVCKDQLLNGSKTRTMRPTFTKTWQKVYRTFHTLKPNWMCNCGDISEIYNELCVCGTRAIQPVNSAGEFIEIPLSVYWSPESFCLSCKGYHEFPPQKGVYRCPVNNTDNIYPAKMFRKKRKLFDAVLTNITKRTLGSLTEEEWQLDGFTDYPVNGFRFARSAGLHWFHEQYNLPLENLKATSLLFPDYYNQKLLDFEVFIIEFRRV